MGKLDCTLLQACFSCYLIAVTKHSLTRLETFSLDNVSGTINYLHQKSPKWIRRGCAISQRYRPPRGHPTFVDTNYSHYLTS